MARLFVAVHPPEEVLDVVETIDRPRLDGVRWTRREHWHVTLRFLGEVEEPSEVVASLGAADLGPPAELSLGPRTTRLGRNVLMVPVTGADELAARVLAATEGFGDMPEFPDFVGHLTLARRRRGGRRPPAGAEVSASWTAHEVTLMSSTLGQEGATHDVVGRFPLG